MTTCTCDPPNEFGIAVCDLPEHCEHASQTGDGDVWVCDACGTVQPKFLSVGCGEARRSGSAVVVPPATVASSGCRSAASAPGERPPGASTTCTYCGEQGWHVCRSTAAGST